MNYQETTATICFSARIAIVGPPNVGKSTLLNQILGEKVSIVSKKAQTTRDRILGILHQQEYEFVFMDTPGLHVSQKKLNQIMNHVATQTIDGADLILYVIEANPQHVDQVSKHFVSTIQKHLAHVRVPVILVLNKIDTVRKSRLLPYIQTLMAAYPFKEIIPLSAKNNDGIQVLLDACKPYMPKSQAVYAPDDFTDQSERKLVSELIREQVFQQLHAEVPYACAVMIDGWKTHQEEASTTTEIFATILVERDSQKSIIIGKGGSRLKEIGTLARREIERLLNHHVYLHLHIKCVSLWSQNQAILNELGYSKLKE